MKKSQSIMARRRLPIIAAADRLRRRPRPTPENPLMISASELKTFLRCRVKWAWRYSHGFVPKERSEPLAVGDYGHRIMAGWYALPPKQRTMKRMEKIADGILSKTTPDDLDIENVELLKAMTAGYAAWARPRDRELGIKSAKTEIWFEEPLTEDRTIIVRGFIDAAFPVASLKRTMGALEHKFKGQIAISAIDLNMQLSVYLWALRRIRPKAKRYIAYYNVLRKQMPGPRVKAALFARESVERTDEEIEQWAIDTERVCLDMLDAAIYPNPMDSCSWDCDYQSPCLTRGNPDDVAHVLNTHFHQKERR